MGSRVGEGILLMIGGVVDEGEDGDVAGVGGGVEGTCMGCSEEGKRDEEGDEEVKGEHYAGQCGGYDG